MTSLAHELASQPGVEAKEPLPWDRVAKWLSDNFVNSRDDEARRKRARDRHDLYACAGKAQMETFVSSMFTDPEVLKRRKEIVDKANYNNVTRRLVNERAVVYSVPASRIVDGDKNNEKYQELQRRCRQHELLRRINRWGIMHGNLAVGFRVRKDDAPVIDVVTPEHFFAVPHPLDPSHLVAIGIKLGHDGPAISGAGPKWAVWSNNEVFYLREDGTMAGAPQEHGLERMPWVLYSLEPPSGRLLDDHVGEDIKAAHRAVWFLHLLELKEAKSATKQPILAGDVTNIARNQAADSEVPIEAPDGVTVGVVDFSMDLSMFRDAARHIYETVAGNHGVAPGVLHHQGVQSAEARELMRAPLKELRREQEVYLREFERELALVQSLVLSRHGHDLAFKFDKWSIDFGEAQTPLDPKKALEVFEHARRLGLTDTVEEMIRRNPDLTVRSAFERMQRHEFVETERNRMMRPRLRLAGETSASAEGDANPDGRPESDDGSNGRMYGDAGQRANGGMQ